MAMVDDNMSMETTILFLVPRLHTNMLGWLDGLNQLGIRNKIFAIRSSRSENYQFGAPRFIANMAPKFFTLIEKVPFMKKIQIPSFKWLVREINDLAPSHIVVRIEMNIASLIFLLAVKSTKVPFIIYMQWPVIGLGLIRKQIRILIVMVASTVIITPSLSRFESWTTDISPENICNKVIFLPFSVPIRVAKVRKGRNIKNDSTLMFLTVGKFQIRKDHLRSIRTLLENEKFISSNSRVTIVGEVTTGEHAKVFHEIREYLSSEIHGERVQLITNLSHSDTLNEISHCDVFFLLSNNEPASISNLEAMSFGKPVIVRNRNGTANYVQSGIGGFVVSDFADFDDKITKFIENPNLLVTYQQENLKRIRDISDPKRNAEYLMMILQRNCDRGKFMDA
jgi:glycosyltransferase involved in cell wall biosynthesis